MNRQQTLSSSQQTLTSARYDIKWLNLKPDLLPIIINETDKLIVQHKALLTAAWEGDPKAKKDLEFMMVSIRARIEDYDNFYREHFQDYRLPYFEKQKFRLRRLIADGMRLDPTLQEGQEFDIVKNEPGVGKATNQRKKSRPEEMTGPSSSHPRPLEAYPRDPSPKPLSKTIQIITSNKDPQEKTAPGIKSKERARHNKTLIQGSINRLFSPKKAPVKAKDPLQPGGELIFSIKMTKEEVNNLKEYRTSKRVKM